MACRAREQRQAIIAWHDQFPDEGYRALTYRRLYAEEDTVAASPETVYRVLKGARRLERIAPEPSPKGIGFVQPTESPLLRCRSNYASKEGLTENLECVLVTIQGVERQRVCTLIITIQQFSCQRQIRHWPIDLENALF